MHRVALCIGIDKYGSPNQLPGSVRSARGIATLLTRRGFRVTTLFDEAAHKTAIIAAVQQCYAACPNQGDVIALYYCGHGLPVGGQHCLVPTDVFPMSGGTHLENCIPMWEWRMILGQRPTHSHVFTLLDCCYSAGIESCRTRGKGSYPTVASVMDIDYRAFEEKGSQFTATPVVPDIVLPAIATSSNIVEYAPCSASQLTVQLPFGPGQDYYSVFTYWLLREMQNPAAAHYNYEQMFSAVSAKARESYPQGIPDISGDPVPCSKEFLY